MMSLSPYYRKVLDNACQQARDGKTDISVHGDNEVQVGVNRLGGVEVQLNGKAKQDDFDAWVQACKERSINNGCSWSPSIFGWANITFRVKPL